MAYSDSFPATRPVFQADFANGGRIDPRATFSRSDTPPTYAAPSAVHYWSNEKHESSQNLMLQSQDLDTTWTVFPGTPAVTGGQTAPDGTTTAWVVTAQTASSAISQAQQSVSSVGATKTYTLSAYLKAGTASHTYMTLRGSGSTYGFVEIDWSDPLNPRVTTRTFTSASATVTAVGSGGWYRVALTTTTDAGTTSGTVYIGPSDGTNQNANGYPVWNSSGETAIAWGVQLEERGSATAYNSTTTQIHREYAPTLKSVSYAGQPRFEYDPTDGESMGILIEGSATNLSRYGSALGSWANMGSGARVESNVAVAPNGSLEADFFGSSVTTPAYRFVGDYSISISSGTTYTASVYLKAAGHRYAQLSGISTGWATTDYVNYDLVAGTVSTGGSATGTLTDVGNGWFRATATMTANGSVTGSFLLGIISSMSDTRTPLFTANEYDGILTWGFQTEASSFASSLVDTGTGGSTATRALESLSMTDSSLFDNGGGTLYAEASRNAISTYNGVFSVDDGSGSNIVQMFGNSNNFRAEIGSGGTTVANMSAAGHTAGTFHKHCVSFSPTEAKYYVNGSQIGSTDTDLNIPTMSQIHLGVLNASGNHLNGHVKRIALYSEALSDTNLQALTS